MKHYPTGIGLPYAGRIGLGAKTPSQVIGDPDFASVVLLLDFAGADGATNITDLSNSAHVDSWADNAQVDTAVTALGKNTLLLDLSTGDWISFPDHANWDFGTADFTIECHFRSSTNAVSASLISNYATPNGWTVQNHDGTALKFLKGDTVLKSETFNPTEGTMYHVVVCRSGTNLRMFIDGVQLGTATTDSTDFASSSAALGVGALPIDVQHIDGYIGAVRITKGVARYTANFTPPTVFYPTSL
jgi:hypothetical protein